MFYGSQGQLENTKELLSQMWEGQVELNHQTYAAIFECVERSNVQDKKTLLEHYHKQMQEKVRFK